MAQYLESRESSSPIITRAVAAALQNQDFEAYELDAFTKALLKAVGYFPQSLAGWLIPRAPNANALDGNLVKKLNINDLVRARLDDYKDTKGPFPAMTMGVGMGGTTAHLSLGLGGPFLPQAFVLTLKHGSMDGNVQNYFNLSADVAREVTTRNPGVMSIQHYDPVHDGWLVRRVNHLRLKLIELPDPYKEFIRKNLVSGGELVYLEGKANWKQYKVGEKNVFQVGGWGDISDEEFLNGSPRIHDYCVQEGIQFENWKLDGYPLIDGFESEWGSEPGLGEALERFCKSEGYRFTKISFKDPNNFNRLAFKAVQKQLELDGKEPAGTIIETFSQFDTSAIQTSGLLPLWLIFNTNDSVRFLREMVSQFPKDKPVFFSPLSTFSLTPDIAKWECWEEALSGIDWINIGTRQDHYPADSWTLIQWTAPLRKWCREHPSPIVHKMTGELLKELANKIAEEN
jgi:hypothetical protein